MKRVEAIGLGDDGVLRNVYCDGEGRLALGEAIDDADPAYGDLETTAIVVDSKVVWQGCLNVKRPQFIRCYPFEVQEHITGPGINP